MRGGILTTGVKFGPDGTLYLADWIEGWDPKDKGRIWTLDVARQRRTRRAPRVKSLIAADFKVTLRGRSRRPARPRRHAHSQKAQFELVDRNAAAELLAAARKNGNQLARIHGIWGLHQLALKDPRQARPLVEFLKDGDPEIRAQAAKLLGDVRLRAAPATQYVALLKDPSPRVALLRRAGARSHSVSAGRPADRRDARREQRRGRLPPARGRARAGARIGGPDRSGAARRIIRTAACASRRSSHCAG